MTFGQSGFFGYGCLHHRARNARCEEHAAYYTASTPRPSARWTRASCGASPNVSAGWHDPVTQIVDAMDPEITVTATLDVATRPTWSRGERLLIGDAAMPQAPMTAQGDLARARRTPCGSTMKIGAGEENQATSSGSSARSRPRANG